MIDIRVTVQVFDIEDRWPILGFLSTAVYKLYLPRRIIMPILKPRLLSALAVLVCVLGVCTPSAFAALEYGSESGKYTYNEVDFTISNGKSGVKLAQIKCAESTFTTPAIKATSLKITPNFGLCKSRFGSKEAETKVVNECKGGFQLDRPEEETGVSPGVFSSTVTLLKGCRLVLAPAGSECEIKIEGEQTQLKSAYYDSIEQLKLAESETDFEVENINDTATKGCTGLGLDESGDKVLMQGPPPDRQHRFGRADTIYGNGYTPIFKNTEPGTLAVITQEFKWPSPGKGTIRCVKVEYTNEFALTRPVSALLLEPSLKSCKIQEEVGGAESPVVNVTIPATCRFRLAALQAAAGASFTGDLQTLNCEIKFEVPGGGGCEVKLESTGPRPLAVSYFKRSMMGAGELEAVFNAANLNGTKIANCPNMAGVVVTYSGTMFVELYAD